MNPYLFTNKINLKTLTFGSNNGEYYIGDRYKPMMVAGFRYVTRTLLARTGRYTLSMG